MNIEVRGVLTLLQVFDMPTSVRFYRDVLGFEIVQTTTPREGDQFDWGLLRLNDTELMLNTAYEQDDRPAAPPPTSTIRQTVSISASAGTTSSATRLRLSEGAME